MLHRDHGNPVLLRKKPLRGKSLPQAISPLRDILPYLPVKLKITGQPSLLHTPSLMISIISP